MSQIDVVSNLTDVVKTQVLTDKSAVTELLKENKILVSILKGPQVSVKVVKVSKVKSVSKQSLPIEEVEALKNAKKMLKNNTDAIYLITLLARTKDVVSKLDVKSLNEEGATVIKTAVESVISSLSTVNAKLLTFKA